MTHTLKKVDDKISHKEFFMGSWYQSGIRDLCSDGWPAFVVPVNMRINKMLNDLDELQTELAQLREKCDDLHIALNHSFMTMDETRFVLKENISVNPESIIMHNLDVSIKRSQEVLEKWKGKG